MTWRRGESGNPYGNRTRNNKPGIIELARRHSLSAINTLAEIMEDGDAPPPARISAAGIILDRAHGKAVQAIEVSGSVEHVVIDMIRALDGPVIEHADAGDAPISLPAVLPIKANGT